MQSDTSGACPRRERLLKTKLLFNRPQKQHMAHVAFVFASGAACEWRCLLGRSHLKHISNDLQINIRRLPGQESLQLRWRKFSGREIA
jgi:hypothetical protein